MNQVVEYIVYNAENGESTQFNSRQGAIDFILNKYKDYLNEFCDKPDFELFKVEQVEFSVLPVFLTSVK